jgi:hypothetical protein
VLYLRRKIVVTPWPSVPISSHPILAQLELEQVDLHIFFQVQCSELHTFQAAYDVFSGRYPCSVDESVRLAALYLQASQGDINPKNYVNEYVHLLIIYETINLIHY